MAASLRGEENAHAEASERHGRQEDPVVLRHDAGEGDLSGPHGEEQSGGEARPERRDAAPHRERQHAQKARRGGRQEPRGGGASRGRHAVKDRQDHREPRVELRPEPGGRLPARIAQAQTEADERLEVGERLGRKERDERESRTRSGRREQEGPEPLDSGDAVLSRVPRHGAILHGARESATGMRRPRG